MARDPQRLAARVTFKAAGTNGGTVGNTFYFHFRGPGNPVLTDWQAICTAVKALWTHIPPSAPALQTFISGAVSRITNDAEVAIYQLDFADPHHLFGSPVHVEPWTLGGTGLGQPLPNEVALVVSLRADYGTDPEHSGSSRPRADDRGRIYLGPFTVDANSSTGADTYGRVISQPHINLLTNLLYGVPALWHAAIAANFDWSVCSRKGAVLKPILYWANDQQWDTQRRRGASDPLNSWTMFT